MEKKIIYILICIFFSTAPVLLMQTSGTILDDSWHHLNSWRDENEVYEISNMLNNIDDYSIINDIDSILLRGNGLDGDPDNNGGFLGGGENSGSNDGLEGDPGDDFISGIERGPIGNGILPILFLALVYIFFIVKKGFSGNELKCPNKDKVGTKL